MKKCIIPIAGNGTRMFPSTQLMNKSLFPLVDKQGNCKPIIHIIIEEALTILAEDGQIGIVIHPSDRPNLEKYFKSEIKEVYYNNSPKQVEELLNLRKKITFIEQEGYDGYGKAVLICKEFVGDDYFVVMLGDHVYTSKSKESCAKQLYKIHKKYGKSVTSLDLCNEKELHINGILKGEEKYDYVQIEEIKEKPTKEYAREHLKPKIGEMYLCFFGIEILSKSIFPYLEKRYEKGKELNLRDAMGDLKEELLGVFIEGKRHDTGLPREYAKSMYEFQL